MYLPSLLQQDRGKQVFSLGYLTYDMEDIQPQLPRLQHGGQATLLHAAPSRTGPLTLLSLALGFFVRMTSSTSLEL